MGSRDEGECVTQLRWRVKLVTERPSGLVTETEFACIERNERVSLAELGLGLNEAKRVTQALQAGMVPAQMTALGECPCARETCGRRLASKGHSAARFRSLFGDVPVRVRRLPAWCRDQAGRRSCPNPVSGSGGADVGRACELQHTVERVDSHIHLGRPACILLGTQLVAEHLLPAPDPCLGASAGVVA